jgi:DNA-binding NtrC family response regulator
VRVGRDRSGLWLQDLGSRNGTLLNEVVLRGERRPLASGDVIAIGEVEIVVAGMPEGARVGAERLERELKRLAEANSGRATLVWVALPAESVAAALDAMVPAVAGAALIESQGDGEYACISAGDGPAIRRMVDELRALAPSAMVIAVRFPEDGASAVELLAAARAAGGRPAAVKPVRPLPGPPGVIVADPAMVKVWDMVRKVAPAPTTVLILGETGVGKEVVAEQIHLQSPRASGPFVRLNCGSLPETLLESELFGYEKGAFTGADRRKSGYLEAADGGTLFLDEIGELQPSLQVKLLRVLEARRFMRVGGREEIAVDVRVLSATNRDLAAEAKGARFREDLYFRLSAFVLRIPPLRERDAEVALLAELFARQFAERMGTPAPALSQGAMSVLTHYSWPGNVRELRNAIEHAVVLAEGGILTPEQLPEAVTRAEPRPAAERAGGPMKEHLAEIEQRSIEEALRAEGGNQTRAAKRLGISRRALIYKLAKYGIKSR